MLEHKFDRLRFMGYRGKVTERDRARLLRADGLSLVEIASTLGVSKSSVSVWTRDVEFVPRPRPSQRYGARRRAPNVLQRRKAEEIERLLAAGRARIGRLSEREFLVAGAALYAGEGSKGEGEVTFANSDPRMIAFFCAWLRRFFPIDETRLRVRVYLHEGLDLEAAHAFWSRLTGIPPEQFRKPYRAVADATMRTTKHEYGCASVRYSCTRAHRAIMGLCGALLTSDVIPG